ncbi:AAA family ATPase [Gordonia sp. CPCC 205515]|uniref:ATPase n=1 Tax=Gordonia sp. CPCC 205515 TaxID=3140791 RepID=UPI003AF3EE34
MAHERGAADRWQEISASPTVPRHIGPTDRLTADDLFAEPVPQPDDLDEKLRRTYFWLVNRAVISPYYDIEFDAEGTAATTFPIGDAGAQLTLPTAQSYSSAVLLPLLTFAVGGTCLLIGGPGRGKTTVAVLMGVLAGGSAEDVRRGVQQGQPQLTISDLVGLPLPRDLVNASSLAEISIAWRGWLTRPVKIVDEYNRIPTKTQSALLTMVAEGYVESHDQMLYTAPSSGVESWFFTANDDAGGGTFPVIAALRDRMDVTVGALPFNSRFLGELIARVEAAETPEQHVPPQLVFTSDEQQRLRATILAVPFPDDVRRRLEFFVSHFEFVQHGGRRFEYRTKDTVATGGGRVSEIIDANTGADLESDLGAQTLNGLSVRALTSLITYAKAIAHFRGGTSVTLADLSAILPFVLRGKLMPNHRHPRFDRAGDIELTVDHTSWLADLFATSNREFDTLGLGDGDPVAELIDRLDTGLDGLTALEVTRRITEIQVQINDISRTQKAYGRNFDDLLTLKYLHQRYTNYLQWLTDVGSNP